MLGGGLGLLSAMPASIKKALAINPAVGSTFYDAEHVVILMQENRSFDHLFGTLQGVRGYNDPRAITLPDQNKVWLQTDDNGKTYVPFRLDIHKSRSTWTGNLPHSWTNQTEARNNGGFDRWLEAKRSGYKKYAELPLTLGYYTREDIPFYYALADAFTVCDQHFCSSLTGTTPNRLFLFTGKLRGGKNNQANVDNENVDYNSEASWETYPERLEEAGISWRVYQNEISLPTGLKGDEDFWLSNFTDNPLEWFVQHRVRFSKAHYRYCQLQSIQLPGEIKELRRNIAGLEGNKKEGAEKRLKEKEQQLLYTNEALIQFSPEAFDRLSPKEKALHTRAFTTNILDPDYHQIEKIKYEADGIQKEMHAPKGDVFYQFRKDVHSGKLPAVSWMVAPQAFSDHPSSPWYGAWYVSEVMDILTGNPEIWKKTIFILTYDENDGYYDHIAPFVAPNPDNEKSGKVSAGLDAATEYVTLEQDMLRVGDEHQKYARESPVGLGYRVPMIVASPWSRGGWVNSQVFDHTSVLQLLESWLEKKSGRSVKNNNIGSWRRAICGNLHSVFRPFNGEPVELPLINRNPFLGSIQAARDKQLPDGFHLMTAPEIEAVNKNSKASPYMPKQEPGIRNATALPYELYADLSLNKAKSALVIKMEAASNLFGPDAAGAPFTIYAQGSSQEFEVRNFSVKAGDQLTANWQLDHWLGQDYLVQLYGPGGFYRSWSGLKDGDLLTVTLRYEMQTKNRTTGNVVLEVHNGSNEQQGIQLRDNSYGLANKHIQIKAGGRKVIPWSTKASFGWYDLSVIPDVGENHNGKVNGFECRFAGRVEDGRPGKTDPLMGGTV